MTVLALACVAVMATSFQTQANPPDPSLVRVFVHTADSELELDDRRTSVTDLVAALASKKKRLAVVETEAAADVVVEVIDRATTVPRVVVGLGPRPGQPPGQLAPVRQVQLRVELTSGDDEVELVNKNKPADNPNGWKSAAGSLADQIEDWIQERRDAILRRRGGQP